MSERKYFRKTNIVCTIGPASDDKLEELMKNGMSVARINFSHGNFEEQEKRVNDFFRIREKLGLPVSIMLDTKGPEIRTALNKAGRDVKVELKEGQKYTFFYGDRLGDEEGTSVSYQDLYKDVKPGDRILIDDGKVQVRVDKIDGKDIVGTVLNSGAIGSRKSINVPGVSIKIPFLSPKDIDDLTKGAKAGFDYVAASFVRSKEDIRDMRKVLDENGGQDIKILAKIENQEGIENFEEILDACDGIMVARGDMAVEVPFEEVPVVQKRFIKRCNAEGKVVITATQMLESMTNNPLPTRAEVSDVANAIYDRTSCVMLSGETAMGSYPIECVQTMKRVAKSVEPTINYWKRFSKKDWNIKEADMDSHAAYTTCVTARDIDADAIIDFTRTGKSARRLAGYGPACPIFAITDSRKVYNQLAPVWNVCPIFIDDGEDIDDVIEKGLDQIIKRGYLQLGDTVALCGGPQIASKKKSKYAVNKTMGGILKF